MHLPTNLVRVSMLAALVGAAGGCTSSPGVGEFSSALAAKLQSEHPSEVDLSAIRSAVAWDELFIFAPYSAREQSCRTLGLGWLKCRLTVPSEISEGEYLFVFRLAGNVERIEHHARSNGDFYSSNVVLPQPVRRSAAQFTVIPTSDVTPQGQQWLRLEYKG